MIICCFQFLLCDAIFKKKMFELLGPRIKSEEAAPEASDFNVETFFILVPKDFVHVILTCTITRTCLFASSCVM